jgi:hypothetical protein
VEVDGEKLQNGDYSLILEAALRSAQEMLAERIEKPGSGGDFLACAEERRETAQAPKDRRERR